MIIQEEGGEGGRGGGGAVLRAGREDIALRFVVEQMKANREPGGR